MERISLVFVLLFLASCTTTSELAIDRPQSQTFSLDEHLIKVFSDGSGSFGRPDEMTVLGNTWHFTAHRDEMTDTPVITAYRVGQWSLSGRMISHSLGVYLNFSKADMEQICVFGHDFPGRIAMLRVGDNPPVQTNENGCTILTLNLDKQLRSNKSIKVRGVVWPEEWEKTIDVNIDGYDTLTRFLRLTRTNIEKGM